MNAASMMTTHFLAPSAPPPTSLEWVYATAFMLLGEERYADAACVFREMIRRAPTDERGWVGVAECHEKKEQFVIALELLGLGSVAAYPTARCHLARARLLRKFDRVDDADDAIEQARAIAEGEANDELLEAVDRAAAGRP
jgi:hypothetical protein